MGRFERQLKEETLVENEVSSPGKCPISGLSDFSEGEQILALHGHGDQLYDAKILIAEMEEGEWRYFVHYHGWNKRRLFSLTYERNPIGSLDPWLEANGPFQLWDEWLGIDRVLKRNKENIDKQQALKNHDADKGKSDCIQLKKRKTSTVGLVDHPVKKTKSDSECKEPDASPEILIDIRLPFSLRKLLVHDWKYVTQQEKLLKVPCCPTVDQILSKYLDHMLKNNGVLTDSIGEFLKGLRCYFDKALPMILLYEKERSQYHKAVLDSTPSAIYGAQHLLRLLVKLPELLAHVNIDKNRSIQLQEILNDFTRFLKKNRTNLFTSSYHTWQVLEETRTATPSSDSIPPKDQILNIN